MVVPVYPYYPNIRTPAKTSRDELNEKQVQREHGGQQAQQGYVSAKAAAQPASIARPDGYTGSQATEFEASQQSIQKTQQGQAITLADILADVNNTMDALGVDDETRQGVALYLRAVEHQAQTANPAKPFIREGLKAVGRQLDGFISTALKQPSRVVMDWVDALLMQPIDFRMQGAAKASKNLGQTSLPAVKHTIEPTVEGSNVESFKSNATPAVEETSASIANGVKEAKQLAKAGQWQQGIATLEAQRAQLLPHSGAAAQLTYWQARIYEKSSQPEAALQAYEQFVALPKAAPQQRFKAYQALAELYEYTGQPQKARGAYQEAVALGNVQFQAAGKSKKPLMARQLALIENSWASLLAAEPTTVDQAQPHLLSARQWALKGDKSLLPDIYSNLAQVMELQGDWVARNQAYLKGMNAAKKLGDQSTYLNLLARYQAQPAVA